MPARYTLRMHPTAPPASRNTDTILFRSECAFGSAQVGTRLISHEKCHPSAGASHAIATRHHGSRRTTFYCATSKQYFVSDDSKSISDVQLGATACYTWCGPQSGECNAIRSRISEARKLLICTHANMNRRCSSRCEVRV